MRALQASVIAGLLLSGCASNPPPARHPLLDPAAPPAPAPPVAEVLIPADPLDALGGPPPLPKREEQPHEEHDHGGAP